MPFSITIGRLVQSLAIAAVEDNYVPGLASMKPDGEVVSALNVAAGKKETPDYFAITCNFKPGASTDNNSGVALQALNRIADDLFRAENYLVVDTTAMTTFWPKMQTGAVEAFGDTRDAYHTAYFASPRVAAKAAGWLGLPHIAATDLIRRDPPEFQVDELQVDEVQVGGADVWRGPLDDGGFDLPADAAGPGAPAAGLPPLDGVPPRERAAGDAASGAATPEPGGSLVSCDVAATVPPTISVGEQVSLTIILSRAAIQVVSGPAAAMRETRLRAQEPLLVTARGMDCFAFRRSRQKRLLPGSRRRQMIPPDLIPPRSALSRRACAADETSSPPPRAPC